MTVIPLPAYSPELKAVENLWRGFRSHYGSNRTYADDDALRLAAIDAWRKAALDPTLIDGTKVFLLGRGGEYSLPAGSPALGAGVEIPSAPEELKKVLAGKGRKPGIGPAVTSCPSQ